jgi:hypothetical protein
MNDDITSLQRQLANAEENLRLIQERKSEYVSEEDIPLQLIKNERKLVERIAELRQRLGLPPASGAPQGSGTHTHGSASSETNSGQQAGINHGTINQYNYYGVPPWGALPPEKENPMTHTEEEKGSSKEPGLGNARVLADSLATELVKVGELAAELASDQPGDFAFEICDDISAIRNAASDATNDIANAYSCAQEFANAINLNRAITLARNLARSLVRAHRSIKLISQPRVRNPLLERAQAYVLIRAYDLARDIDRDLSWTLGSVEGLFETLVTMATAELGADHAWVIALYKEKEVLKACNRPGDAKNDDGTTRT